MLAAKLRVLRQHVGQARRVREQVVDGDGAAVAAAEVRQELRHCVGQRQLAPIAEPQHGRRRHRLGRRREQERHVYVRHAEGAGQLLARPADMQHRRRHFPTVRLRAHQPARLLETGGEIGFLRGERRSAAAAPVMPVATPATARKRRRVMRMSWAEVRTAMCTESSPDRRRVARRRRDRAPRVCGLVRFPRSQPPDLCSTLAFCCTLVAFHQFEIEPMAARTLASATWSPTCASTASCRRPRRRSRRWTR